jgi:uncharacterized membrane protein YjfL (UPF0719 family)
MVVDELLTSLIYLLASFLVFVLGHWTFRLFRMGYRIKHELVERDNAALALVISGYYIGLICCIGGVVSGPSAGLEEDLTDILVYGVLSVILLNVSAFLNDSLILSRFRIRKEILIDKNCGTGVVEFAVFVASGLNIFGAVYGQGGNIYTVIAFWFLGQLLLITIGRYYNLITHYDIHDHIENDNVAVGVGFAGALVATGILLRAASAEDFVSWFDNLFFFGIYIAIALALLPIARVFTDRILLPGRNLADELVKQEHPNLGAAFLEAASYIGSAFLIVWCL